MQNSFVNLERHGMTCDIAVQVETKLVAQL